MSGYSGTPLAAKLGIKAGMAVRAANAPDGYRELLAPLPVGARIATRAGGQADLVHHFSTRRSELGRELALPLGFVDVKVCAVSDVWSGLKLVVRKELREGRAK